MCVYIEGPVARMKGEDVANEIEGRAAENGQMNIVYMPEIFKS